jgi:hypothetical protein
LRFERPKGIIKKICYEKTILYPNADFAPAYGGPTASSPRRKNESRTTAVLKAKALRLQLDLTENQEGTVKNVLENQIQTKWKPTMKSFFTMLNTF